jgi:RNA polymerase sigma-32 factor
MAHHGYTPISRYIAAANQVPLLGRSEEFELATRWRAMRDRDAAGTLVRAHLRYVVAMAVRYRRYGIPLDELVAEGNFGVVHALGKFEPERGTRFVTYAAFWIRAYILQYVIQCWSMVGGGSGPLRSKLFFRLRRERARITSLVGSGEQADQLLGERLGMSPATLGEMLRRLDARDVSLDQPISSESGASRVSALVAADHSQEQALMAAQRQESLGAEVRSALAVLDPRERYIVNCRLMADSADQLSLAAIGRRLGVSRERVRQLEVRTKHKLRAAFSGTWVEPCGHPAAAARVRARGPRANEGAGAQAGAGA